MAGIYLDAGKLNRRIQILRRTETETEGGYTVPQEELVHGCWAQVTRQSGTEMVKANADFGTEKVRFLIRWTDRPIDRKMFVRFEGKEYEIEYINDYGRPRQYQEIWATWKSREGGA